MSESERNSHFSFLLEKEKKIVTKRKEKEKNEILFTLFPIREGGLHDTSRQEEGIAEGIAKDAKEHENTRKKGAPVGETIRERENQNR